MLCLVLARSSQALTLYAIDAYANRIFAIDPITGASSTACMTIATPAAGISGMGVVVIGTDAYYTHYNGEIRKVDLGTCSDTLAFNVPGAQFGKIACDGTDLWIGNYSSTVGLGGVDQYTVTGTLIKTINLSLATHCFDGLNYYQGQLISNRWDNRSPYDVYDLNGNLVTTALISPASGEGKGIACDGAHYYIAQDDFIEVYDVNTKLLTRTIPIPNSTHLEGISFDYAAVLNTPSPTPTISLTSTHSATITVSPTVTPTFTATATYTATLTATPTATPTISVTSTITPTVTPTCTITQTLTPTPGPLYLRLYGNNPNPFVGDGTHITFWVSEDARMAIRVFTVAGETVRDLDEFTAYKGYNEGFWDGRNKAGQGVASGIFIYRVKATSLYRGEVDTAWGKAASLH